jgi:hypothetical protein
LALIQVFQYTYSHLNTFDYGGIEVKVLLVSYKFSKDIINNLDKLESMAVEGAKRISNIPGLRWKIYLYNDEKDETAGVYLFEDEDSLNAYLNSPIMAQRKAGKFGDGKNEIGDIADVTMLQFDVLEEMTAITRGPV